MVTKGSVEMIKRFINIGNEIHLNGEWWCSANGEHCADIIATALNEVFDENEQLEKKFKEERYTVMKLGRECDDLTIKNQKLELEIIKLRQLITKKNELDKKIAEIKDDGRIISFMNMFDLLEKVHDENKELKSALKELKKELSAENQRVFDLIDEKISVQEEEKACGTCKYFQIDGMFGTWCDKDMDWANVEYCKYYER